MFATWWQAAASTGRCSRTTGEVSTSWMVAMASMRTAPDGVTSDGVGTLQLLEIDERMWPQEPLLDENQESRTAADGPDFVTGAEHAAGFGDGFRFEKIEVAHGGETQWLTGNASANASGPCATHQRRHLATVRMHNTASGSLQ